MQAATLVLCHHQTICVKLCVAYQHDSRCVSCAAQHCAILSKRGREGLYLLSSGLLMTQVHTCAPRSQRPSLIHTDSVVCTIALLGSAVWVTECLRRLPPIQGRLKGLEMLFFFRFSRCQFALLALHHALEFPPPSSKNEK